MSAPRDRGGVFAVASGGGHWQQMMELLPAFAGHQVIYATTLKGLAERDVAAPAVLIPDCHRTAPLSLLRCALVLARHILRQRPDIVVSTGALPGLVALALGKATGARTIWIDSVANARAMSLSGSAARGIADLWLTQWPEVAQMSGARYAGSVL